MQPYSNETTGLDRLRIASIEPVDQAIRSLEIDLLRLRKLNTILNALEVQIEDGGDHPEVNAHLIAALRLAVVHYAGEAEAAPVLAALDQFEARERERWERIDQGLLPVRAPLDILDDLEFRSEDLLANGKLEEGCALLAEAWEIVKAHATPEIRSSDDFYEQLKPADWPCNWVGEWTQALKTLGEADPAGWGSGSRCCGSTRNCSRMSRSR